MYMDADFKDVTRTGYSRFGIQLINKIGITDYCGYVIMEISLRNVLQLHEIGLNFKVSACVSLRGIKVKCPSHHFEIFFEPLLVKGHC
jgi:hypothetical protein